MENPGPVAGVNLVLRRIKLAISPWKSQRVQPDFFPEGSVSHLARTPEKSYSLNTYNLDTMFFHIGDKSGN
jgi:hypothetical protein